MKKKLGNLIFYSVTLLLVFVLLSQIGLLPFRAMFVRTGSMVPAFYPGDLAFVYVGGDIRVSTGDVIMFHLGNEPVLHRVVRIENGLITTKGDANNAEDFEKLEKADGKLVFTLPKIGYAIAAFQSAMAGLR